MPDEPTRVPHPIWLVRHATTEWSGRRWLGRRDLPLTDAGREEAQALAVRLAGSVPRGASIVSSPARRAVETAEALAVRLGVAVEVDPDLREVDVGRTEGLTWAEVEAGFPDFAAALVADARADWPGGETADAIEKRVRAVWGRLLARPGATIAVSHGGVIAGVLAELGATAPSPLGPGGRSRWIRPAAAILLRSDAGRWLLEEA